MNGNGRKCSPRAYKPIHPLPLDLGDPTWSTSIRYLPYGLQNLKSDLKKVSREDSKSITSNTHLSANGCNNTLIAIMWLTKSGNDTAVTSNLCNKKPWTLEQRTTHSFGIIKYSFFWYLTLLWFHSLVFPTVPTNTYCLRERVVN